jgi:Ni/Co efflux regulator RcnB
MKRLLIATTALTLLVAPMSEAFAQSWNSNNRHDDRSNAMMHQDSYRHDDRSNVMMHQNNDRHDGYGNNNGQNRGWHRGGRIERNDWNRGQRVNDYHRYHLSRPPRGYEWRRVDNNYVLAAAATGLIASIILANQ